MKEIANEIPALSIYLIAFFIILFSIIKVILLPHSRGFRDILASFLVSFPVGFLTSLVAIENGVGEKTSIAIGCIVLLIADKLLIAILHLDVSKTWQRAIDNLVDKYTK